MLFRFRYGPISTKFMDQFIIVIKGISKKIISACPFYVGRKGRK